MSVSLSNMNVSKSCWSSRSSILSQNCHIYGSETIRRSALSCSERRRPKTRFLCSNGTSIFLQKKINSQAGKLNGSAAAFLPSKSRQLKSFRRSYSSRIMAISSSGPGESSTFNEVEEVTTVSTDNSFESQILEQYPSQLEPKVFFKGKFYTLKEMQEMRTPASVKFLGQLKSLILRKKAFRGLTPEGLKSLVARSSEKNETATFQETREEKAEITETTTSDKIKLNSILRPYRNKLYVPEEAFGGALSDVDAFNEAIKDCPSMTVDQFLDFATRNQIKMLVSKPQLTLSGKLQFQEFLVQLKEVPGEKKFHRETW